MTLVRLESENVERTRNEALAAVIVPNGLINAGFNFLIFSIGEGRIPLSTITGSATSTITF